MNEFPKNDSSIYLFESNQNYYNALFIHADGLQKS